MSHSLVAWAVKWGVSEPALSELREMFGTMPVHVPQIAPAHTEAYVQSRVRVIEAPTRAVTLFRNNVGVLEDKRDVPVRYGLANDTKALNAKVKSGDLIGWRSVVIEPKHVGVRIAQFVSRECKRPDWKYSGDEHEQAQLKWAQIVVAAGGDACFCTGEGTL